MQVAVTFASLLLLGMAQGLCSDGGPIVFKDMHDGDHKEVAIRNGEITITPHNSTETWKVVGAGPLDVNCSTAIDFRVPGKPNPPPFELRVQVGNYVPGTGHQWQLATLVFTTKMALWPYVEPLNIWAGVALPPRARVLSSERADR